jgi:hypothetical protein
VAEPGELALGVAAGVGLPAHDRLLQGDVPAQMREEARQKGLEARKKALSDPMPVPDNEEERVYAP